MPSFPSLVMYCDHGPCKKARLYLFGRHVIAGDEKHVVLRCPKCKQERTFTIRLGSIVYDK